MSAVEDVSGVAVGAVGDVSVPRPGRRGGWSSPAPVPALQQRLLQRPAAHEGTAQHQLRHGEFKCLFINIKCAEICEDLDFIFGMYVVNFFLVEAWYY